MSGKVNMIPTLRKFRGGGHSKQIWGGGQSKDIFRGGPVKKNTLYLQTLPPEDCDHYDDDFDRIIIFPPRHHYCPATECLRSHNFLNIQQSNYPLTHLASLVSKDHNAHFYSNHLEKGQLKILVFQQLN